MEDTIDEEVRTDAQKREGTAEILRTKRLKHGFVDGAQKEVNWK